MPTACGCAGSRRGRTVPTPPRKRCRWFAARPMHAPGWSVCLHPVGTHVPGTGVDLKPGVIRGQGKQWDAVFRTRVGNCRKIMMVSSSCLWMRPLGVRYIDYAGLNDPVIEIAITPNRPDALGVRGHCPRSGRTRGLAR